MLSIQKVYAADAYYPGKAVEISCAGYIRDQAVAQVQFYPVQYNPVTGELRLYRRIVARITWDGQHTAVFARMRGESPAYENLLRSTIVNYQALDRPLVGMETQQSGDINAGGVSADGTTTVTLKIGVTEDGVYKLRYCVVVSSGTLEKLVNSRCVSCSISVI